MFKSLSYLIILVVLASCVPAKKYQELEAKYKQCQEDEANYKSKAIDFENKMKELEVELEVMKTDMAKMKEDTTALGNKYRMLQVEYDRVNETNQALEEKYAKLMKSGSKETAKLINDLEGTRVELQKKEDRLNQLEKELDAREIALNEKEARINELESIIETQQKAFRDLKEKIANALRGFEDKGISVVEKDGKIYVSMEAKLLFASGSTAVGSEGKAVLIDLAKVLESQKDIDIIVEGHTDSDPLKSSAHPKDNWELSVLRATSVVKIMLANSEMDPLQITAAGRSEYHPVDPDDKSKNRRIEIIISPDLSELFDLISS
jgi:chemotaxis protein MotB